MSNAGQAVLSVAGAAVGFWLGGPAGAAWGFSLGGMAGSALFPTDLGTISGPRLNDLSVQTSTVGAPIPIVYGTYAIAGNLIWSSGIIETMSRKKQGGKGGPTQTVKTYTYKVNCAVGICEGEILSVRRIWADAKLIYDEREQQDGETDSEYAARLQANAALLANTEFYLGSDDQLPDPTIESFEGAGNVSAFRELAYVVFSEFQLADYGNRVPNFRFEVSTRVFSVAAFTAYIEPGTYTWPKPANLESVTVTAIGGGGGGGSGAVGVAQPIQGGQGGGGGQFKQEVFAAGDLPDSVTVTVGAGGLGGASISFPNANNDGNWGTDGGDSSFGAYVVAGRGLAGARGDADSTVPDYDNGGGGPETPVYVAPYYYITRGSSGRAHSTSTSPNGTFSYPFRLGAGGGGGGGSTGTSQAHPLDGGPSPDGSVAGGVSGASDHATASPGAGLSPADHAAYGAGAGGGAGGSGGFYPQAPGATSAPGAAGGKYGGGGGGGGGADAFGVPNSTSGAGAPGASGLVLVEYSYTDQPLCTTLGQIVADICRRCGLPSDRVDVSDLTECVDGYVISRTMSGRDAISPLRSYGFFDCVESDGVLKWPTRGKAAVATLTSDDLCAHEASTERPSAVEIARTSTVELPRRLRVHYAQTAKNYEPGEQAASRLSAGTENVQDVEIAVAMNDDKGAEIAEVLLYDAWVSRNAYQLVIDHAFLALEPADAITAPVDGRQERLRIISVGHSLPGLLRIEAVRDDDGAYQPEAIGAPSAYAGTGDGSISAAATASVVLLDLPRLRDTDVDAGYYAAPYSPDDQWRCASIYRSSDGGTTYDLVAEAGVSAIVGSIVADVDPPGSPSQILSGSPLLFDEVTEIVVDLNGSDELSSVGEATLVAGDNLAAIGADGRWEIIQFRDAVLQGSPGQWVLSGLWRGLLGTDAYTGTTVAGDKFVLLSDAGLLRIAETHRAIGFEKLFKTVACGSSLDATTAIAFTTQGLSYRDGTLGSLPDVDVGAAVDGDVLTFDEATQTWIPGAGGGGGGGGTVVHVVNGRLTLTSGTPITTADVTGATNVYFTPLGGNHITLWDGSEWVYDTFSEVTLALGTLTSGKPYDVFGYLSSGNLALEALAWTNDTTRATAVTLQDGRYCKSGDKTRLYLGTFYTTSTTQTEDSLNKRYLFNQYNRVTRPVSGPLETTNSWTYTTATWRQARATSTNQFEYVNGDPGHFLSATVQGLVNNNQTGGANVMVGIGIDSTSVNSARFMGQNARVNDVTQTVAQYRGYPGIGRHYIVWLERAQAVGTTTWYGDAGSTGEQQAGIFGEVDL